jgi:hypothetical protein
MPVPSSGTTDSGRLLSGLTRIDKHGKKNFEIITFVFSFYRNPIITQAQIVRKEMAKTTIKISCNKVTIEVIWASTIIKA